MSLSPILDYSGGEFKVAVVARGIRGDPIKAKLKGISQYQGMIRDITPE